MWVPEQVCADLDLAVSTLEASDVGAPVLRHEMVWSESVFVVFEKPVFAQPLPDGALLSETAPTPVVALRYTCATADVVVELVEAMHARSLRFLSAGPAVIVRWMAQMPQLTFQPEPRRNRQRPKPCVWHSYPRAHGLALRCDSPFVWDFGATVEISDGRNQRRQRSYRPCWRFHSWCRLRSGTCRLRTDSGDPHNSGGVLFAVRVVAVCCFALEGSSGAPTS